MPTSELEQFGSAGETRCALSEDNKHCEHWYDGYRCHHCNDGPMDPQAAVAQGMYESVDEALADQRDFEERWAAASAQPRGQGFEFGPDRAKLRLDKM